MAEDKKIFQILKFLLLILVALSSTLSLRAGDDDVELKKGYVKFADLKKRLKGLSFTIDPATLIGEIRFKDSEEIKFKIDTPYYFHQGRINIMSKPLKYRKRTIYLPKELVEAVFIYLVDYEISYRFTERHLLLKVYEKIPILPETINLEALVIDPGHGGTDPGAISVNGEKEKDLTLKIAKRVTKYLKKKFPTLNVVFTRSRDEYVELQKRAEIANYAVKKNRNTIFVSLHCNSTKNPQTSPTGFEIYYLAQTYDIEAKRENVIMQHQLIDLRQDKNVSSIQTGMMSSLVQRRSVVLAKSIEKELQHSLKSRLASRGVKKSNFHVLRGSVIPAVLIEMGFMSHPEDVKMLGEKNVQLKLAEGIAEGIKNYVLAKN